MNIITKTQYVCPLCGKESEDRAKIEECAASHSVVDESVPVVSGYGMGSCFPDSIDVTMKDGFVIRYERSCTIAWPNDEEGETEVDS